MRSSKQPYLGYGRLWGTIVPANLWGTIVPHTYFVLFLRVISTWLKDPPKKRDTWSDLLLVANLAQPQTKKSSKLERR